MSARTPQSEMGLLDRADLGGWLLLLAGLTVVGIALWLPARLDVADLEAQCEAMAGQIRLLDGRLESHGQFQQALKDRDPLLLRRLAWHHLHLRPADVQVRPGENPYTQLVGQTRSDQWSRPSLLTEAPPGPPRPIPRSAEAHTTLARLATGSSRPWVLGFGLWLVLMGLLSHPAGSCRDTED